MNKKFRRVVTTRENGVLEDTNVISFAPAPDYPGFELIELFYSEDKPFTLDTRNFVKKPYKLQIPDGAFRFYWASIPPLKDVLEKQKAMGINAPSDMNKWRFHKTDTLDFIYILSGEITYVLDNKKFILKQGDFLAQLGPAHTWHNHTDKPCELLAGMMGVASQD